MENNIQDGVKKGHVLNREPYCITILVFFGFALLYRPSCIARGMNIIYDLMAKQLVSGNFDTLIEDTLKLFAISQI